VYNFYFREPLKSPRLAYEILTLIGSMSEADPVAWLRGFERASISPNDQVSYLEQNSVRPACVTIRDELLGTIVLISGTQGALHVQQLVAGWLNPGGSIRASGACPAFENAALDILSSLPAQSIDNSNIVRIFGYSYGGATGQVMADELANNQRNRYVDCCSFASPRPGNIDFQSRMSRIPNVRWFADDDPVRFMPPHVPEVPSALYFLAIPLWQGMDTQVQCPTGMQLEANGNITETEGNPTRLHSVIPSIYNWITDTEGFQSVNHARENYMRRLSTAIQNAIDPVKPPDAPPPERPAVIVGSAVTFWREEAETDVVASPTLTLPPGQTVAVTVQSVASTLRYRRKKQGRIWTVQYDGVVVAVGPGKRRAGQIARAMNRAARIQ